MTPTLHQTSKAALHEAAHAVVGWALGMTPERISIIDKPHCLFDNSGMVTEVRDEQEMLAVFRERIVLMNLAGDIGEGATFSERSDDYKRAMALILDDTPRFLADQRLDLLRFRATRLVERHRELIGRVARNLDVCGYLSSRQFSALVEQ